MAKNSHPPPEEPSALPRRTPGAGGLTPGQIRRGFLSHRAPATPAAAAEASTPDGVPVAHAEGSEQQPPVAGSLPRRAPGESAIQAPPLALRRPRRPADTPTGQTAAGMPDSAAPEAAERPDPPSPAALAASAASLMRATATAEIAAAAAAELAAAAAPRRQPPPPSEVSASGSAAPAIPTASLAIAGLEDATPATDDDPARVVTPEPIASAVPSTLSPTGTLPPPAPATAPDTTAADTPLVPATRPGRRGQGRGASPRRWQLAGLVVAVLLVVGAVVVLITGHRPTAPPGHAAPAAAGNQRLATAAVVRSQAVGWVATQVGHNVSVACDAATCSALAARGFPAGNLNVLPPAAPDPYGSALVIATADIRNQFGSKLDSVFAPQVIASFGTGSARIDIQVIAPLGPTAFRIALAADLAARKLSGAQLLRNPRITVSASARALLAAGLIDSRLLTTIAFLAAQHPIDIVGFGAASPGGGPVPLRSVYLAQSDSSAHMTGSAYVQALESVLQSQNPPYVPLSVGSVSFGGGAPVLQVEFAAPSPLGLLRP